MKLYNQKHTILSPKERVSTEEYKDTLDKDIDFLDNNIHAFNSLVVVENQISKENFSFIDKGNYVLYNQYITSITKNIGVCSIPIISQESVESLSTTALNHYIALEGFISDIWEKIKLIFNKIYNSIKEFFKKWFTRLGRTKNKLKNLYEVVTDTKTNLSNPNLNSVPSFLVSKYPVSGDLTSGVIKEVLSNVSYLVNSLDEINKAAANYCGKDILDKDFIENISKLKSSIASNKNEIDSNNKDKQSGSLFKEAKFGKAGKINSELNEKNDSLEKTIKEESEKVDKAKNNISGIVDKESDLDNEYSNENDVNKEFDKFIKTLESILKKTINKPLINGKTISKVSISSDDGIDIESEKSSDKPSTITLGSKETLAKMIKDTISIVDIAEKLTKDYGKVNDTIMANMDKVSSLILSADKIDDAKIGKYKKLLNTKIKLRLNMAKSFFNNYNKVSKSVFEMCLDSADGVIYYSILSLKNFG